MQLYRKGSEYDETENVGEAEELSPEEEEDETLLPEKRGYRGTQLVLIIQIAACAVVLLAAFVLKSIGGDVFTVARDWYLQELNRSVLASANLEEYETEVLAVFGQQKQQAPQAQTLSLSAGQLQALPAAFPQLSVMLNHPLQGGTVSSVFGVRDNPLEEGEELHQGIDIAAAAGTPILCALPGTVLEAQENDSYGKYLLVDHGNGVQTLYAHCSELKVEQGQQVARGDEIALVGSTGAATGEHLHLELILQGIRVNPQPYLMSAV